MTITVNQEITINDGTNCFTGVIYWMPADRRVFVENEVVRFSFNLDSIVELNNDNITINEPLETSFVYTDDRVVFAIDTLIECNFMHEWQKIELIERLAGSNELDRYKATEMYRFKKTRCML
jgi:hypothetical protein